MESSEAESPTSSKIPRRLGFSAILGFALFGLNRGFSAVNASPSWITGTAWFAASTILLVISVWFWEYTTQRHWGFRLTLSLLLVAIVSLASLRPIRDQYK